MAGWIATSPFAGTWRLLNTYLPTLGAKGIGINLQLKVVTFNVRFNVVGRHEQARPPSMDTISCMYRLHTFYLSWIP